MEREIIYWTTKSGDKIDVDKMSLQHLRNALKMVIRNIEYEKEVIDSNYCFDNEFYK